ncbi:6-carboxytetrahydropterin synthase [bacterium]|jgi:6-pyruvoyltetrahydropterin/6-carboxytetrahydropterin synthase|nr:6-carboxytetrahydropterin synthase [bacterium]
MFTCRKVFADIPFAHRQFRHEGRCAFIHGHNWSIEIEFACKQLDQRGFVVDFGGLGFLKTWIDENLDHACLFAQADPQREALLKNHPQLFKALVIESVSTEGIAQFLFQTFDPMVRKEFGDRAWVQQIILHEDSKNSARYQPDA